MDMTAQPIEVHLRTDANNLVTTAASTRLPEQKETIHMSQMLRDRDSEEWIGETIFNVEACAHAPAQSLYTHGLSCTSTVNLDPSHVSSACQAEENVVCDFKCLTTPVSHCCYVDSRSAATGAGVHLPSTLGLAVYSLSCTSSMPGPPTKSTMNNLAAARQKVGPPSTLGANPRSYFLKQMPDYQRMDVFNGMFSLYLNDRLFKQKSVREEFWAEDPTALTELLVKDGQWYDQHFRKVSKMITMLRRSDDQQIRLLRRNRIQGDI